MVRNKLIIAAAGSGKTTNLIKSALSLKGEATLITTFTEVNEQEIKNKIIAENGFIPDNIIIQTWFSLLIQHGIKPYQNHLFEGKVRGLYLVSDKSAKKYKTKYGWVCWKEEDNFNKHYFNHYGQVYSDKLAKLVVKVNKASNGLIFQRLSEIFRNVFVDEAQDLAGYDLALIKELALSTVNLTLVCDPRQVTYLTHWEAKFKKYRNGLLKDFIENECKKIEFDIDLVSLNNSYRCNPEICSYSNKLFPDIYACGSANRTQTGHDGIFIVKQADVSSYLEKYSPIQLRWSVSTKAVDANFPVFNFGSSKGLTFDRVLIYPTKKMENWIRNEKYHLTNEIRAKFYVALTRARYSVGIVWNNINVDGIDIYSP